MLKAFELRIAAIIFSAVMQAAAPAQADDTAQEPLMYEAGSERWPTILVGGITRRYIFNIPQSVKSSGKPAPMLIMLHGAGQGPDRLRISTMTDQLSEEHGYIAVYPQGLNGVWNDGRPPEVLSKRRRSTADDKAFLSALAERFVKEGYADPERIYLAGVSNGGFLAIDISCSANHPFAAIATAIAGAAAAQFETCDEKSFVPFIMVNGTDDALVPWNGSGEGKVRLLGIPEIFDRVSKRGGCRDKSEQELPDRYASDGVTTTVITSSNCSNGGEVVLYRMNKGGHQLPSHRPTTNERMRAAMFGLRSIDIDTNVVLWDFFKRFKKQKPSP